jgi:protein TonB
VSAVLSEFAGPATPRRRPWLAFGSALGVEAAIGVVVVGWLITHRPQPAQPVVPLTIEAVKPPVIEKPPEPEKPRPTPPPAPVVAKVLPRTAPPPPTAATPPVAAVPQAPEPAPAAPPAPVAAPVAAAPAPAPPPPPPSAPAVDPSIAYNARLSAAVQAAFEVPAAAAALNFKGRTRVEFSLRDGVVSAIRVVQSSGLGLADRAAMRAVQVAAFPAPPPALQGKEGVYQIWVACL